MREINIATLYATLNKPSFTNAHTRYFDPQASVREPLNTCWQSAN